MGQSGGCWCAAGALGGWGAAQGSWEGGRLGHSRGGLGHGRGGWGTAEEELGGLGHNTGELGGWASGAQEVGGLGHSTGVLGGTPMRTVCEAQGRSQGLTLPPASPGPGGAPGGPGRCAAGPRAPGPTRAGLPPGVWAPWLRACQASERCAADGPVPGDPGGLTAPSRAPKQSELTEGRGSWGIWWDRRCLEGEMGDRMGKSGAGKRGQAAWGHEGPLPL